MILKCGNGTEWSYIDNILSFTKINEVENLGAENRIIPLETAPEVFQFLGADGGKSLVRMQFHVKRKGDAYAKPYIVIASDIYLLSDEGKTIERIN